MRIRITWEGNERGRNGWRVDRAPMTFEMIVDAPKGVGVAVAALATPPTGDELKPTNRGKGIWRLEVPRIHPWRITRLRVTATGSEPDGSDESDSREIVLVSRRAHAVATLLVVAALILLGLAGWVALKLPPSTFSGGLKLVLGSSAGSLVIGQMMSLRSARLPMGGVFHQVDRALACFLAVALLVLVLPRWFMIAVRNDTSVALALSGASGADVVLAPSDDVVFLGPDAQSHDYFKATIEHFGDWYCDVRAGEAAAIDAGCVVRSGTDVLAASLGMPSEILGCRRAEQRLRFGDGDAGTYELPRGRDCAPRADAPAPRIAVAKLVENLVGQDPRLAAAHPVIEGSTFVLPSAATPEGQKRIAALDDDAFVKEHLGNRQLLRIEPSRERALGASAIVEGTGDIASLTVPIGTSTAGWTLLPLAADVAWFPITIATPRQEHVLGTVDCATADPRKVQAFALWELGFARRRLSEVAVYDAGYRVSRWSARDAGPAWMCLPEYAPGPGGAKRETDVRPEYGEVTVESGWTAERSWSIVFPTERLPRQIAVYAEGHKLGQILCNGFHASDGSDGLGPTVEVGPIELTPETRLRVVTLTGNRMPAGSTWSSSWTPEGGVAGPSSWPWHCRPSSKPAADGRKLVAAVNVDRPGLVGHVDFDTQKIDVASARGLACWQLRDAPLASATKKIGCRPADGPYREAFGPLIARSLGCDPGSLQVCDE